MKKIKRLILHIGTIKTGSTSIQQSLGFSRVDLLKYNIYYPSIRPYNHNPSFLPIFVKDPMASFGFRRHLEPFENINSKIQNYRKIWIKEINNSKQDFFIISAEDFTLPFFDESAILSMKDFLDEFFDEFTVIVYVRHYDTFISSHIQEVIKDGDKRGIKKTAEYFLKCPPQFSYEKSIQKWVNVFGRENLVVRPFDPKTFYNGSLLDDFLHACKLPANTSIIPEVISNPSLGRNTIAFMEKFNQSYPLFINNRLNSDRGLARQVFPLHLVQNIVDEKFKLKLFYTPEQAKRFNKEINYVNKFFDDGYQFKHISSGTGEVIFPNADDIPIEFFVEMINNYNKYIETLQNRNKSLQNKVKKLQEKNIFYPRIREFHGVSRLKRILNRLKLKSIIQKITKWSIHEKN